MYILGEKNHYYLFDPYNFHYLARPTATGAPPLLFDGNVVKIAFKSAGPHLAYLSPADSNDVQCYQPTYLVCSMTVPAAFSFSEAVADRLFQRGTKQWLRTMNVNSIVESDWINRPGKAPSALEIYAWAAQLFAEPPSSKGFSPKPRQRHTGLQIEDISRCTGGQVTVLGEKLALPANLANGIWQRQNSMLSVLMGAAQLEEQLSFRTGLSVEECRAVLNEMRHTLVDMQVDVASLGVTNFEYSFLSLFQVRGQIKRGELQTTVTMSSYFKKLIANQIRDWRESIGYYKDSSIISSEEEIEDDADSEA